MTSLSLRNEVNKVYSEFKALEAEGKVDEMNALIDEERAKLEAREVVNDAAQDLAGIRKARNAILIDRTMSREEKRRRLDELQQQANDLTRAVARVPEVAALR